MQQNVLIMHVAGLESVADAGYMMLDCNQDLSKSTTGEK